MPVHADTLVVPPSLEYAGLTFEQPLTFITPQKLSTQSFTFQFQSSQFLTVNQPNQPTVAQITVSPTPQQDVLGASTMLSPQVYAMEITPSPTPTPLPPSTQSSATQASNSTQQTVTTPSNPGGLNADILFSMVNSYRESKGLPAFQKDDKTCSLAESRAPEVNNEIATGTMHSGLRALNLPYWNTENIISMNSEQAAFNWWINDPIHLQAIVSSNKYSCVACSGNACAEEFTSYQPK